MHFVGCLNFEDPCSMKYPPVVSTLEEWLDGKLGIEGIDAVSCAFYVLSLLQRDEANEPEAFYQFPCSKIVDDQGLSYWPQNSWSNWGFDCYENSLAAKCVSAPVQRYEIEHLGNDLSPSLKSIKSEGGDCSTQRCLCNKQCFSLPIDQVERCQEAFPVRGQLPCKRETCNITSLTECKNTLWANESACVGFFKHKLEGGGLEEKNNSSSMAEKVVHEKGKDFWMADPTDTGNNLFLHEKLWEKKDGSFFSWSTADDKSSTALEKNFMEDASPEEVQDVWEPDIFCKQANSAGAIGTPYVGAGAKYGDQGLSDGAEEDKNLAQLIAKFDHSVEAIWDLDSAHPVSYGITDEQQNLPWSFHSVVSPPQDVLKMDQNSFENNSDSVCEENSFIHSGTNIINSIWSTQPFVSNSASQIESGVKYVSGGVNDFNNCVNDDHSDLCCKLKVLLTTDEILHNEFNLFGWNSGISDTQIETSKNTNGNYLQEVPQECSNVLWDKIQTIPTLLSNVNFQEQFCHMENIQDADCEHQQNGNSCMISCSPCPISRFQGSCQDRVQDTADNGKRNFITLNHNREDSSFTEVLPRHAGTKKLFQETKIGNLGSSQNKLANSNTGQSSEDDKGNFDNVVKEEEEDLLTSARTHFRPIQQENQEPHNNPACCYADGTTFVISSNLAEVPFKRSESGTLFLENDDVPGTPKKYMEYKDKRSGDLSKCARNISKDNLGNKAFIPKFCVSQIEKCCQTDESDESSDELNSKRVKRDCAEKEMKSNLFFSEDEIVKSVANYLDEDDCKFSSNEIGCKDNFDDERMDEISAQNAKNDSVTRSLEAEMYIWNRAGCKCNNNYMFSSKSDSLRAFGASFLGEKEFWEPASAARLCQSRYSIWSCSPGPQMEPCPACETLTQDKTMQYSQLREELSEDGEQLLSDLSSLQPLQLSAGWLDDALDQGGWGTEPNLLTRVSSRRRLVSWGQCGEG